MPTCECCNKSFPEDTRVCPDDGTLLRATLRRDDPFIGRVVDQKYRIIEKIGDGGMGAVYRAEHLLMNRTVALKVLRKSIASDFDSDEFLRRFQAEARTASKINHPNAVTIHDFGIENDSPYLVMEFNSGESLKSVIAREGALAPNRILNIMIQVCGAIDEAHALGIVHRDLKPDNIMISKRRDGSDMAMVLDFGIAKILTGAEQSESLHTRTGAMIGTPKYMSPEQIMSAPVDNRCDIYSLGVIVYEMLAGEVPFDSDSVMSLMMKHVNEEPTAPHTKRQGLSAAPALEAVILRALRKKPEDRQSTVAEFLQELKNSVEQPTEDASLVGAPSPSRRVSPVLPLALSVAAVVAIGIYLQHRPEEPSQVVANGTPEAAMSSSESSTPLPAGPTAEELLQEGIGHIDRSEFAEAEVSFKRAIELEPLNAAAHKKVAALYTKLGREEEALSYWEEATYRDPSDARSFAVLGLTYKKLGKLFEARVALNKAATLDPTLAMARESLNQVDQAIADESLKRARLATPLPSLVEQLKSDDRDSRAEAANLLEERGEEAVAPLQAELQNDDPRVRYWVADVLGRLKATSAVPALIALLRDRSSMVQGSAERALRQIGSPEALAALSKREAERAAYRANLPPTGREARTTTVSRGTQFGRFLDDLFN